MTAAATVAVLLPARDEGPRIGAVLQAARQALPTARLLVVDGGSTDDTAARARHMGAEVIGQPGRGYADALRAGYAHLLHDPAIGAAVQLDADGQHPASALPALLAALEASGADWVIGSRAGTRSPGPWGRRLGNAALSGAVWLACGQHIADVTSGLWALNRAALAVLARQMSARTADANVRVLAVRAGLRVREVPVQMALRDGGASMHDGLAGLRHFRQSLWAVWDEARA